MTGEAGAGKTTSLCRLAIIAIDKALSKTQSPIPVCLSCDMLTESEISLVVAATNETRRNSNEKKAAFTDEDLDLGRVLFLIDGLDELTDSSKQKLAINAILETHNKYPKCKIIVASRDYQFINDIMDQYPFERYQITPLGLKQAERMIARLSKGESLSSKEMKETLRRLENVHGLRLNPLLVTVFVATSDYSRTDIPANITELFKKFTEVMLGRWHKNKGVGQQYHHPLKDFVLQRLAFHLHSQKKLTMKLSQCEALIEEVLVDRDLKTDVKPLTKEIVYQSGLLKVNNNEVMFRHLLLQEFFAGRGIEDEQFLSAVVTDSWWSNALIFYFGERPNDSNGLKTLRSGVDKIINGNLFQAAVTVGLASQACYLMKKEDKKEALNWVVSFLSLLKEQAIDHYTEDDSNFEVLPIVNYFIFGRDAVAAKIIKEVAEEKWDQLEGKKELSEDEETELFWCISGLIESRKLQEALDLIKKYNPRDPKLLLGLHMNAFYVQHIHITDDNDKKLAGKICDEIGPRIEYLRKTVIREMKDFLLEVRRGKITLASKNDSND